LMAMEKFDEFALPPIPPEL